ncbi:MAG TPA: hypothetical protein VMX36_02930 [Sedimentisphaerales bacterium]|nr:hypothetical protein [Sedimentisphaerales bacterium]
MRFKTVTSFAVISICALLMTASCSRYGVRHQPTISKGNGPPAHAPAHGYRRKHVAGMELVFDSGRGVYVVVGLSDHYYHDGYFYRLRGSFWEMSIKPDGDWKVVSQQSLPMGLQVKAKANGNGKGNGKGKVKHKKDTVTIGRLL